MQNAKRLLLVENEFNGISRTRKAFEMLGIAETLVHVSNANEAMECLSGDPRSRPSLIVLDLDPDWDQSIDFLRSIKENQALQYIPVVVTTSSHQSRLMMDSFAIGVAGYIIKPEDNNRLVETIKAFGYYWTLSQVPTHTC